MTLAGTLGLGEDTEAALFDDFWEKCEKTLRQDHPRLQKYQLERAKKRMNSVLGEYLEGVHREYQRSAPQSARNTFLRGMRNIERRQERRGCHQSVPLCAAEPAPAA